MKTDLRPMRGGTLYFAQVKCTGTLFDNFCSGEITFSCTHSSTVFPGFPNFHLWLTALTPGSESLRRCSGQVRPWESTQVYVTVVGRVVAISPWKTSTTGQVCCSRVEAGFSVTPVMTGPAGGFVGTGAMAATGDSGNNPNANTAGPNNLTEPAICSSP